MTNGISEEKFKEEMLRLMKFVVIKIGENSKEIALLRKDFDENTRELRNLRKEVRANSGIFENSRFKVFDMYGRLFEIENQINLIADTFPYLREEYRRIYSELIKLIKDIDDNPDVKVQLDELNIWLENLEEKVFV